MPQTPAPTRANVRQSATWRISDTNLSPPCQLTTHAADSMLFLSKSRLFGFLPTKFPEYPGDVVLYASYSSTNNTLIVAQPRLVTSRPGGTVMNSIYMAPSSTTLSIGDSVSPDMWATYTNGLQRQLYIPIGQIAYTSSNTNIAAVDYAGTITLKSFGDATVTASYNGFTASIAISSVIPSISNLTGYMTANGFFQLSYMGSYMMTNVIQASTDLRDWVSLSTL